MGNGTTSSRTPFVALIGFTVVLVLAPQAIFPILQPLRLGRVFAIVALIAQAAAGVRLERGQLLAGALVSWAIVTLPFSFWRGGSVDLLLDLYFKALVIFWLLCNAVNTVSRLSTIVWALVLMSAPLSLIGIKNYATGSFLSGDLVVERIRGYEGALTANPNDLALTLNLLLPLSCALLLNSRSSRSRVCLFTIASLAVITIIATFSRAGFIGLLLNGLLMVWKFGRGSRVSSLLGVLLVAAICAIYLPANYVERVTTIFDPDSDPTGSAQARRQSFEAGIRFVMDHPVIGAGVGMSTLALNEVIGPQWREMHNVYLQYAIDLGLPGLALFFAFFLYCLRSTIHVQRYSRDREELRSLLLVSEGLEVALITLGICALFYPIAYQFYFYYFGGLAIASRRICDSATVDHMSMARLDTFQHWRGTNGGP